MRGGYRRKASAGRAGVVVGRARSLGFGQRGRRGLLSPSGRGDIRLAGCSAAWLARLTGGQKVGGSNPPTPISTEGVPFEQGACTLLDKLQQQFLDKVLRRGESPGIN